MNTFNKIIAMLPAGSWKALGWVGTIASVILSVSQLGDYYETQTDEIVKGAVTEATIQITREHRRSLRLLSEFIIDDMRFRLMAIRDQQTAIQKAGGQAPRYLSRQEELLRDQLEEAREKWLK